MSAPATWSWLVAGYALLLLIFAWGFDRMARHTSERAAQWRTGKFVYHEDHDAWKCPEDQWLWPTAFDPENRVMRYRATPAICNVCPVKDTCTTSMHGREIIRAVDPWPHSETGRFHRGIACAVAGFGIVMPLAALVSNHGVGDVLVLLGAMAVVIAGGIPLARHFWKSPGNAPDDSPEHVRQLHLKADLEAKAAAVIDRYSTRWGGFADKPSREDVTK